MQLTSTLSTLAGLVAVGYSQSITQVTGFNMGPTAVGMYVYVPPGLKTPAPIIVAIHHCQGNAEEYSQESGLLPLAAAHNFIAIFPNSKSSGGCFDVSSTATLTHNGGGDSQTIANMVTYAVNNYGGDASKVFVSGTSSGAMMTNVMVGAYPEVFQAGSVYSGVPDGCFYVAGSTATQDPPGWNSQCADGQVTKTAQAWGDLTRSYYPGYNGTRPRMQIWHGTADTTLYYANYAQTMLQWSNVLGVSLTSTNQNTPQSGYTQTIYGSGTTNTAELVGYSAAGVGHTVPIHVSQDLAFFGL
ncbi:putative Acetylxylan esterase A [Xylariaceae sp. FL0255]|nr:putative Acetylxylan esterase A [Xylariaceae sp. FL0255]